MRELIKLHMDWLIAANRFSSDWVQKGTETWSGTMELLNMKMQVSQRLGNLMTWFHGELSSRPIVPTHGGSDFDKRKQEFNTAMLSTWQNFTVKGLETDRGMIEGGLEDMVMSFHRHATGVASAKLGRIYNCMEEFWKAFFRLIYHRSKAQANAPGIFQSRNWNTEMENALTQFWKNIEHAMR